MFGIRSFRNFFVKRPLEEEWMIYSSLDVVYLETTAKNLEKKIVDLLKIKLFMTKGFSNLLNHDKSGRGLSLILSQDHAKNSCDSKLDENCLENDKDEQIVI